MAEENAQPDITILVYRGSEVTMAKKVGLTTEIKSTHMYKTQSTPPPF